ncbi:metallo cofactor biosynthesis protein [Methanosarcinales archaeon]|nr:MAG: metallo cofactor biosynthesis protein [Methanosarcinales archaeon]
MSDTVCYEEHGNLYLNITNRCTAECEFCIKRYADGVYGYNLRLDREPLVEEVIALLEESDLSHPLDQKSGRTRSNLKRYDEIVFAGLGEPLTRLDDVIRITRWLKAHGERVRIDTIGHVKLYHSDRCVAAELRDAGVDAVSLSLNAHNAETYNQLCHPSKPDAYTSMLEFAGDLRDVGIRTRFTVVNLPIVDIERCRELARDLGCEFKIRGYGKRRDYSLKR